MRTIQKKKILKIDGNAGDLTLCNLTPGTDPDTQPS